MENKIEILEKLIKEDKLDLKSALILLDKEIVYISTPYVYQVI